MEHLYQTFTQNFTVFRALTEQQQRDCHALRYRVYCLEHPYEDPTANPDGLERDCYDKRAEHALVRHSASGITAGVVRLVLADKENPLLPFPMEEFGLDIPKHLEAWFGAVPRRNIAEISRFAVSKEFKRRIAENHSDSGTSSTAVYQDIGDEARRLLPHITLGLFAGIVRMSADEGITHWYAVMEPTLLRLLGRFGIYFDTIGPLVQHHGWRQPAIGEIDSVLAGIYSKRPEVWEIVTDCGRFWPLNKQLVEQQQQAMLASG